MSLSNNLNSSWIYSKHLGHCNFPEMFDLSSDLSLGVNIIYGKTLTSRIQKRLCSLSIISRISSQNGLSHFIYTSVCILHGKVLYLLSPFWLFFVPHVTRLKRFSPCFQSSPIASCFYRLWMWRYGIRLKRAEESIWFFWFLVITGNSPSARLKVEQHLEKEAAFSDNIISLSFASGLLSNLCALLEIPLQFCLNFHILECC